MFSGLWRSLAEHIVQDHGIHAPCSEGFEDLGYAFLLPGDQGISY